MPVVSMLSGKIIKAEGNSNGGQLTLEISGKRSIIVEKGFGWKTFQCHKLDQMMS